MQNLSEDLLWFLFSKLPWKYHHSVSRVCKQWNSIILEHSFRLLYPAPRGSTVLCSSQLFPRLDPTWKELFSMFSSGCCGVDPAFRVFNLNGDKDITLPRKWLDSIRKVLRCPSMRIRIEDMKGGIFLITWAERHDDATVTGRCDYLFPVENVKSPCLCFENVSTMPRESERQVLCLLNAVTQSFKICHSRGESHGGGMRRSTHKLIIDSRKNNLKTLFLDSALPCTMHDVCDMWSLSFYDVIRKSSSMFSFHSSILIPQNTSTHKFRCLLYDATILGDELFFVTTYTNDSIHAIWKFSFAYGSIVPTRLADITNSTIFRPAIEEHDGPNVLRFADVTNCTILRPAIEEHEAPIVPRLVNIRNSNFLRGAIEEEARIVPRLADITNCTICRPAIVEHEGRIMLIGWIQNITEVVSCVWEYDVSKNRWIFLPSFLQQPRPWRINREEMPGWDLAAIFTANQDGEEYVKWKMKTNNRGVVLWNNDPKSVVMIERRLDMNVSKQIPLS